MRRCEHGNYIPAWATDDKSPYCSGCTVPEPVTLPPIVGRVERTSCPECGNSTKFKYKDEWNYHCYACGLDALD